MAKCNDCYHVQGYVTGDDEYPQRTYVCWCNKGHWENGDPNLLDEEVDCPDFMQKPDKEPQCESCVDE